MATTKHSAAGQALGYVYQVGWGLLELLRPGGPEDSELRLETIDDVSWHDAAGDALRALQVKHHEGGGGTLSDASTDVWRTIRVWLDDPVLLDPAGPALILMTTQAVPAGSALSLLGTDGRDPAGARDLLDQTAASSKNRQTQAARDAWLHLSKAARDGICRRIQIVSEQGTADQLASLVQTELRFAAPRGQEAQFTDLLLGWWWRVAIDLLARTRRGVARVDVALKIEDLREQFSSRNLPITVGRSELPESLDEYRDRRFARQLEWIGAGDELLLVAAKNYYQAYAQMQHWVENSMVELSELGEYEERLVEEWTLQFELARAALGSAASDDDKRAAGLRLYSVVMNQTTVPLRPDFRDPFYGRGTHHRLADESRVGWHPDFRRRLEQLLGGSVA